MQNKTIDKKSEVAPDKNSLHKLEKKHLQSAAEEIKPDYVTIPVPKIALNKGMIITEDHIDFKDVKPSMISPHIVTDPAQILGQQVRRILLKHRPIELEKTGPVILIKRNQDVSLIYRSGAILITTDGRALSDGGTGEKIKVMNLESRKIVTGQITDNGDIDVSL
ncbi:MAG: flagellar basal body P-ring formation chaperone FlgA [Pseudomonadota bacterium]